MRITFDWLEAEGYPSVTDFCRDLVKDHQDEEITSIEVYRGDMLCLTVTDIRKAATLQPTDNGWRIVKKDRARRVAQPR